MKSVYQCLAIIALCLVMCFAGSSCEDAKAISRNEDGNKIPDSCTFRVRTVHIGKGYSFTSSFTKLKKLPIGYRTGDSVSIDQTVYILGLRVN